MTSFFETGGDGLFVAVEHLHLAVPAGSLCRKLRTDS
jgi:hypothetical protein